MDIDDYIKPVEQEITPEQLYEADQYFLTGTAAKVTSLTKSTTAQYSPRGMRSLRRGRVMVTWSSFGPARRLPHPQDLDARGSAFRGARIGDAR